LFLPVSEYLRYAKNEKLADKKPFPAIETLSQPNESLLISER
jgi:hypothetical protein